MSSEGLPVDGVEQASCPLDRCRAQCAVPSGRSRQSSIRNTSSRSTATGSVLLDDQRPRRRWARLTVAEQAEVAQEGAGVTQRDSRDFRARPRAGALARQRFGGGYAVDPVPVQRHRDRQFVREREVETLAAPGIAARIGRCAEELPAQCIRSFRRPPPLHRLCACRTGTSRRSSAAAIDGSIGPSVAAPRPAINSRRSSQEIRFAMTPIRTIFRWISPASSSLPPDRLKNGHFFAANRLAHVISPPPAASRPEMMLSAGVAELVDALDLGSSDESCGGSSPSARTKR